MPKRDSSILLLFLLYDVILISASFAGSIFLKYGGLDAGRYIQVLPIVIVCWISIAVLFSSENFFFRDSFLKRLKGELKDFVLFTGMVSFVLLALELHLYSRLVVFGTILGFFILRNLGYFFVYRILHLMRSRGRHVSRILVLGAGRVGGSVRRFITSDDNIGYELVGFLDDRPNNPEIPEEMVLGKLSDLESVVKTQRVDEIIIALPFNEEDTIRDVIERADFFGVRVRMIPDYFRLLGRSFRISQLGRLPIINLRHIPLDKLYNSFVKRCFDVVFSSLVLIFLTPILLVIAVLIKLDSKGPVLYRPVRVGEGGRTFQCLKYRTMKKNEDSINNQKSTIKDDPRITDIGHKLRKYNLDELPQFLNVLMGTMSVVGPRPHRPFLNTTMQSSVENYMVRHYVKPGITGWAQVNGWRGPTETDEQKEERTRHDLWYLENWSFWLDLEIILRTVFSKSVKNNAF